ncbi:SLC13 family permease [Bhargavaea massiliensis]|uniref:SLC13 family permease n=1 Tax=Bhargavaea massiliensis TaxID=2697500 RepID=UPI001BCBF5BB|nr:DASS family sodium-coupled anion symporter [Bhargavaea massiliensis]
MKKGKIGLFILVLLFYLVFIPGYTPFPAELKALVVLVVVQILWIGRVFPLALSALILILILSLHFFSYEKTLSYFASPIVWLMFSTFFLSGAFISTGLATRVSLFVLGWSRGSSRLLILISFVLTAILSVVLPSNVGKASLAASVYDSILKNMGPIADMRNTGKSMFIGLTYIVPISGALVATGASSTIYAFGLMEKQGAGFEYLSWLWAFSFPVLLFLFFLWILAMVLFPPEKVDRRKLMEIIDRKADEKGRLSSREWRIMIIISLTLVLWVTQPLHGVSIPLVGLLGAVLTLLPPIGVWNWEEARTRIDWDMMLFFAATIMVSEMLIETGTLQLVSDLLVNMLGGHSKLFIIVLMVLLTMLLRLIFVNILGLLTIMLPLAITVGQSLPGDTAMAVAMAVFLASIPGFLFIIQSPVHLISFSYQYFSERDLLKIGLPSMLIWTLLILFSTLAWW